MTTSGTYATDPSLGELVLYAYNRAGVRNTAIIQEHMEVARMAANMVLSDFSNKGVDLWQVELVSIPLVQGTATYSMDPNTVVILDGYVTVTVGGVSTDRYILPVSRSEYASYPNKAQQGFPTTYWLDRLLSPSVTLWPVPDGNETSFNVYVLRQSQDAAYTSGQTVEIPYLWLKAFSDALAVELAVVWNPDRLAFLVPMADKSYAAAADRNVETSQFFVSPVLQGYWRA